MNHPAVHDFEGMQRFDLEDWNSAIEAFGRTLKFDASHKDALVSRGTCFYNLEEYEKAVDDFVDLPLSANRSKRLIGVHSADFQDAERFPQKFPGGYRDAAQFIQPGFVFIKVEFVEPGKDLGMSFASIVQVDGKWYWFPKPWRFLD